MLIKHSFRPHRYSGIFPVVLYTDQNSNMGIIHVFQWHPASHWLWHIVVGLGRQLNFQHLDIILHHPETRYLQSSQYWYIIGYPLTSLAYPLHSG